MGDMGEPERWEQWAMGAMGGSWNSEGYLMKFDIPSSSNWNESSIGYVESNSIKAKNKCHIQHSYGMIHL